MQKLKSMALCAVAAGMLMSLHACTWVKTSEEAESVALVKAAHVETCKKMATTTSTVKEKVGIIERKEEKVGKELVALAKNEAVKIGGDTILADGPIQDGSQKFVIYRCN